MMRFLLGLLAAFILGILMFGPKKLPDVAYSLGKSVKEFRRGMNEDSSTRR